MCLGRSRPSGGRGSGFLGHAGGSGYNIDSHVSWMWDGAEYGDPSAVMGNDAHTRNSFTVAARWRRRDGAPTLS